MSITEPARFVSTASTMLATLDLLDLGCSWAPSSRSRAVTPNQQGMPPPQH